MKAELRRLLIKKYIKQENIKTIVRILKTNIGRGLEKFYSGGQGDCAKYATITRFFVSVKKLGGEV